MSKYRPNEPLKHEEEYHTVVVLYNRKQKMIVGTKLFFTIALSSVLGVTTFLKMEDISKFIKKKTAIYYYPESKQENREQKEKWIAAAREVSRLPHVPKIAGELLDAYTPRLIAGRDIDEEKVGESRFELCDKMDEEQDGEFSPETREQIKDIFEKNDNDKTISKALDALFKKKMKEKSKRVEETLLFIAFAAGKNNKNVNKMELISHIDNTLIVRDTTQEFRAYKGLRFLVELYAIREQHKKNPNALREALAFERQLLFIVFGKKILEIIDKEVAAFQPIFSKEGALIDVSYSFEKAVSSKNDLYTLQFEEKPLRLALIHDLEVRIHLQGIYKKSEQLSEKYRAQFIEMLQDTQYKLSH